MYFIAMWFSAAITCRKFYIAETHIKTQKNVWWTLTSFLTVMDLFQVAQVMGKSSGKWIVKWSENCLVVTGTMEFYDFPFSCGCTPSQNPAPHIPVSDAGYHVKLVAEMLTGSTELGDELDRRQDQLAEMTRQKGTGWLRLQPKPSPCGCTQA